MAISLDNKTSLLEAMTLYEKAKPLIEDIEGVAIAIKPRTPFTIFVVVSNKRSYPWRHEMREKLGSDRIGFIWLDEDEEWSERTNIHFLVDKDGNPT